MKTRTKFRLGFMLLLLGGALMGPYLMSRYLNMGSAPEMRPDVLSTESTRQTYFKWQDANGQWHFGDEPPEGVQVHSVNVDTAANILQPVAVAKKQPEADKKPDDAPQKTLPLPMTVDPDGVKDMMEKAENVQNLMNERNEQLKQLQ
ncbi:hypothetical protein CHH28_03520 [Bacterioplanes sanyensis]|uniref:DUF4124 domain-containing protein n=1 Tax=Bacterioplanes sanyensis TaxID=1249553 RepID=A0A222FFL3_9GAMM|nr:DUF4124 domain-containing protein [Bacterioplanes sanyensis]ASP37798.1 hypothetical protein CHH28_03520 [Bacterioplanes sanyensis]